MIDLKSECLSKLFVLTKHALSDWLGWIHIEAHLQSFNLGSIVILTVAILHRMESDSFTGCDVTDA